MAHPLWMAVLGFALLALHACTPYTAALFSAVPDGTTSVLLSHLQGVEEGNRKRVVELEGRKDWDGLLKFAEENLAKDANSAGWWTVAGYANSKAGRHEAAVQCYTETVRLAPDDMQGWNLLAQAYRDAKQPARAIQTLNHALLVRKGSAETWLLLGDSYSDLDRDLPATAAYREAVQLNGELAQAWFGLGRSYARLGRRADFEKSLAALQKLDPALANELSALRPAARN